MNKVRKKTREATKALFARETIKSVNFRAASFYLTLSSPTGRESVVSLFFRVKQ